MATMASAGGKYLFMGSCYMTTEPRRNLNFKIFFMAVRFAEEIAAADYARNPWQPEHLPQIALSVES